ncbi:class II aldolase/adducin family protein [Tamilnaduibacter salinus]|uniref:class II aldolase/adducin family protein n=1 Tax=Tamilnaduibacter salinus TaxID=1484056 RepID=UPI001D174128|nr:class II aldolase/adducin family protein [Tamilnaduibacter salinus]
MTASHSTSPDALRNTLVETARAMNRKGLNQGRSGNVSVRYGDGMLITASGCHFDEITPEHVVATDLDGHYQGPLKPSSERSFHAAIYRQRPDAQAVVHVHSPWATTLASLRRAIPAFHYMVAVAGGKDIPCTPYATFGTDELADHIANAVRDRDACLMANHGQIALAGSLDAALDLAMEVENLARCYAQALTVGEPVLLSDDEMDAVLDKFGSYRENAQASDEQ